MSATDAGGLDLDAIEARTDAASSGPWHEPHEDGLGCVSIGDYGWTAGASGPPYTYPHYDEDTPQGHADAEFIAHAREDVPALVAEVRALRAKVARVEAIRSDLRALPGAWVGPWVHSYDVLDALDAALDGDGS